MMEKTELTLYLGGTRSGKSARAEAQALRTGGPVLYVATAEARPDDLGYAAHLPIGVAIEHNITNHGNAQMRDFFGQ